MGQDARHSLLARLKRALEAKGAVNAVRRLKWAARYYPEDDHSGFTSLVVRHCREYGLPLEEILLGTRDADTDAGVAITPVFAMGSTHPRTGTWRLTEIDRIALSSRLLGPTRFVTRMDSRALEPRIHLGAYLVVDTAQEAPPVKSAQHLSPEAEGVPFAMDLAGEGLVVRLTRYDADSDAWELASLDRAVPPMRIARDTDGCRLIGRVVWVAQQF